MKTKIKLCGVPKAIMSNPLSKHSYFAWPTIVRLKNGKIAVGASGFRLMHICPFGKAVISFSEDEGKTYTQPAPVIDTPLDDRDAGLCAFGDSGLIVTSFNNKTDMQREVNKMRLKPDGSFVSKLAETDYKYIDSYVNTVTPEEEEKWLGSTYRISYDNGVTFGDVLKSPITSPHGPTVLSDGTILWVGKKFPAEEESWSDVPVQAYKVNTDGKMELLGEVPPCYDKNGKKLAYQEPYAFEVSDDKIICHIRMEDYFSISQTESFDGGRTWTVPHMILPERGGAPSHIMKHSSGKLIASYGYRDLPYGIRVAISFDGGETWETDHVLYEQDLSVDIGYPSTLELCDGSLITVFYAHTEPPYSPAVILQQRWVIEE